MEILVVCIYLLLSVGGLILIKFGVNTVSIGVNHGIFNCSISLISILGLICYIGSFLIFTFFLVKKFDLTYLMPVVNGLSQVMSVLAGIFIFKEQVGRFGIIGIVAVILGIVLMNIK